MLSLHYKLNKMARQSGPVFIEGTLDDLTFYKMDGVYYVRMKSSLTRKKVLESPRFENTRRHASQFAEASKIASTVYRSIPKDRRDYKLFRKIVGRAKILLSQGKDKDVVLELVINEFLPQAATNNCDRIIKSKTEERVFVNKAGSLEWKTIDHPNLNQCLEYRPMKKENKKRFYLT